MFKKTVCIVLSLAFCFSALGGICTAFAQDTDAMAENVDISDATTIEEDITTPEEDTELPNPFKLGEDIFTYTSTSVQCRQIPCEKLGGIYFLNGNKLGFLSLSDYSFESIYTFEQSGMYFSGVYCTEAEIYALFNNYSGDNIIVKYDLLKREVVKQLNYSGNITAIGVDDLGRIYIAKKETENYSIRLLSSDGEELSFAEAENIIYDFYGFDSTNGNFYVNSYANWVYWGYDHDMCTLRLGNVKDNTITYDNTPVLYTAQKYFYDRQRQAEVLGNKYLCVDSTYQVGLSLYDSNGLSIDEKALSRVLNIPGESAGNDRLASVGTRTIYRPDSNSIITYKSGTGIAEYDIESGKEICSMNTAYPVFSLLPYGEEVIAVEKNDNEYYLERILFKKASYIIIAVSGSDLKVGETAQATAMTDSKVNEQFTWSSSDSKIASVNEDGVIFGLSAGTATITVQNNYGLKASCNITVGESENAPIIDNPTVISEGANSYNASYNNYSVWSSVVNSYLVENEDGTFTRVEAIEKHLVVETFENDMKTLVSHKDFDFELEYFGGFFSGKDYNFVVYGQTNPDNSDDCEIMRVVKYDKTWKKVSAVSICGANTFVPFEAGSLRMTETEGKLYIYTCHKMYKSDDGLNHQANMIYVVGQEDMDILDYYFDVMNISQAGYVSHSFNQFIATDGENIYRVDHGDYYPRGITLIKHGVNDKVTDVNYTIPISLSKVTGYNPTGASVGGFEISTHNCLIAGNSVDYTIDDISYNALRNIFVTVTDKALTKNKVVWLTDYTDNDGITVRTPHLVKIGDDQFLVMWEELKDGNATTKMVTIDGNANITSNTVEARFKLSDCKPIYCADGSVRWYVTENGAPVFYAINPLDLEQSAKPKIKGDINEDGVLDIIDVALARSYIVGNSNLSDKQISLGDMNEDGILDIVDVVMMRRAIVG